MRVTCLIALPIALAACKTATHASPSQRPVVSEVVSPQAGLQTSYVGTVAARTETDLGFPIAGTLAARTVEEGDVVARGAALAMIDPKDVDAGARAAAAGVSIALAELNSAQDADARAQKLVAEGVDSPSIGEATSSALAAAKARLAQAKAALAQAQELKRFATLTAPQNGVITHVYMQPGAAVTAGEPVVRLAGIGEREVLIDLTERDAVRLSPGAVFRVRLQSAPNMISSATLRIVDPVADPATRTRRLHLTLAKDAPDAFRIGSLVLVEPDAKTEAQYTLPATALIGGTDEVWLVDRSTRKVHRIPLHIGRKAGGRVLVLTGLRTGEEVLVKGVNSIKDGQIVGPRVAE